MTLTDQLRSAVNDSGLSVYRIAKDSGVSQPALRRFVVGERDIRLESADKLAAYFSMRLTQPRFPKGD